MSGESRSGSAARLRGPPPACRRGFPGAAVGAGAAVGGAAGTRPAGGAAGEAGLTGAGAAAAAGPTGLLERPVRENEKMTAAITAQPNLEVVEGDRVVEDLLR